MEDHAHSLTQLAVVLAGAFIGGTLLQTLRQPVLVGYILVGLFLGPSMLGLIHDREQIGLLAELGILLLLFVVGMELDLKRFAPVYRVAIITTLAQIIIGVGTMALIGALFDWPLGRILLLGFAMSLSSTAVAIKLLQDMGETNTPLGRASIGILIAQDIAVVPMLLIVGAMGGEGFHPLELLKIVLAVGFMAVLILALNSRPEFFVSLAKRIPTHSQRTIVALAFCFSAAALAGTFGISAGYGAFLAGLVIGNTTDHDHYEKQVQPIFDLLMMVFFLSIGLLIDLGFLFENFWNVLFLLGVIMVMKTVVNIKILRMLGLSRRNAIVMGASLGQIGEFSFILAGLGLASGTIASSGYNYVISVIALSLVFTPLWLYVVRRMHLIRHRQRKTAP